MINKAIVLLLLHSNNINTIVYTVTRIPVLQINVLRIVYVLHFCVLCILSA